MTCVWSYSSIYGSESSYTGSASSISDDDEESLLGMYSLYLIRLC